MERKLPTQHVKLALEYDIDVLWVGARTTVNPFAMQELADALQGTKKLYW
jgi:chorismate mutase